MKRRALLRRAVVTGVAGLAVAVARAPIAWAEAPPLRPPAERVDRIEVRKADRVMILYQGPRELGRYQVALGFAPEGDKTREGDGKTPEGVYRIDRRNDRSRFHLSLGVSYPSAADRAAARAAGVDPGGDIFIHGLPNGYGAVGAAHRLRDWTLGCIAVTNAEIEEIWSRVPIGTPIEIKP